MPVDFELLHPEDRPALLAFSNAELMSVCEKVLVELGYKVHDAVSQEDLLSRFRQLSYQLVIIEEQFNTPANEINDSLDALQRMPMHLRRHATIILVGESFQSLNAMQAFQQSVHAVVHPNELVLILRQIVEKVVRENDQFMSVFYETRKRLTQGKTPH